MKRVLSVLTNENGSPLVIVLLILVLLTLVGLSVLNTTSVETEMAGHHRRHKEAFYGADGGTEIACELIEQNLGCPLGFTDNTGGSGAIIGLSDAALAAALPMPIDCPDELGALPAVFVSNLNFWENTSAVEPADTASSDLFYPANWDDACPRWQHTNLTAGGRTELATGSAIQMMAGYEGKGKGAGQGGGHIYYDVFSRRTEYSDDCTIQIRWRHAIGQEGACNY